VNVPATEPPRLRRVLRALRRPRYAAAACLLLALLAGGAYAGGRALLFEHHLRGARAALDDQDCDEARPHLAACLRLRPDSAEVHFLAARGFRRAGFHDEAADHLNECQRLGGQTPATVLEWAMLAAARGEVAQNEPFLLARLAEGAPESSLILEALAQGSIEVYHLGLARHYLEELLAREPDNVLGLMWQGWLYETQGRDGNALENYRRAVRLRPRQPQVRLQLARLAQKRGELDEAAQHLEELRRRGYKRADVLLALARCRRRQDDRPAARALLDERLAEAPDDAAALTERGRLALDDGDAELAERLLRRAVEREPRYRQALYDLQRALSERGNQREADEYGARLGQVEAEMNRLEAVYKQMGAAPGDVKLRYEAGDICLRNGQEREALRWLTGALQLDPRSAPAHERLAECYERLGDARRAEQHRKLAAASRR
jgi:predicted Zn-dependent protease